MTNSTTRAGAKPSDMTKNPSPEDLALLEQAEATRLADEKAAADAAAEAQRLADELAAAADGEVDGDERWASTLIVVRGGFPVGTRRPVIVVQETERESATEGRGGRRQEPAFNTHRNSDMPPIVSATYPEDADAYFAMDPVDFGPGRVPVIGVGNSRGVQQAGTAQFATREGYVHVGPASPIFAAANYAFTRGAKRIEIIGTTEAERDQLAPWFAELTAEVTIVITP